MKKNKNKRFSKKENQEKLFRYEAGTQLICTNDYKGISKGELLILKDRRKSKKKNSNTYTVVVETCTNREVPIPTDFVRLPKKNEQKTLNRS